MTTGGCIHCSVVTMFCGSCGARFCGAHGQDAFAKHPEFCPGIYKIGEIVSPQPWTNEQFSTSCLTL